MEAIARRLACRGEPLEDLVQVGSIGLIKAVDRFDPRRGVELRAYAALTIAGEIRRYLRDRGWPIAVPRAAREQAPVVEACSTALMAELRRAPTPAELGELTGLTAGEVRDALRAATARTPAAIAADDARFADPTGESALARGEDRAFVTSALLRLTRRERRVLALRYFCDLSQDGIAAELGLSQVHVSRMLRSSLERLRVAAGDP